jgi:DNA-directed RNA polymerase subunit M/transcription elongation factor TFIIS
MTETETILCEPNIIEVLTSDKAINRAMTWFKFARSNHEKCWDGICLLNNVENLTSFKDVQTQLEVQESHFFKNVEHVIELQIQPVDADKLLNIDKKIGMVCPECKEQETSYKLYASRSADEGMTAVCECRTCKHNWRIKM